MKIQPLQQMADHIVRLNASRNGPAISIADNIRSVKWKLWHGQTDRAIDRLEKIITALAGQSSHADPSAKRLLDLAQPLLAYVRQTEALSSITARATEPADGSLPHSLNPPSIRSSPDGWSRSSRCNGRCWEPFWRENLP
jgi:hypothetical protein